jgi:hypothetical protein
MADPAAAYLVPEDHRANRKNGRANPDDRGGFFSEMNGVGFIPDQPHRKQYVPAKIGKDPPGRPGSRI